MGLSIGDLEVDIVENLAIPNFHVKVRYLKHPLSQRQIIPCKEKRI
jgi:hypothetical protein